MALCININDSAANLHVSKFLAFITCNFKCLFPALNGPLWVHFVTRQYISQSVFLINGGPGGAFD